MIETEFGSVTFWGQNITDEYYWTFNAGGNGQLFMV